MDERVPTDRLDEYRFVLLGLILWLLLVVAAVLGGDPGFVAAGNLLLPAVLVGWAAAVLATADGVDTRAVGGLLLLVGGVGEVALYFAVAPDAGVLALTLVWLSGVVLVVLGRRED